MIYIHVPFCRSFCSYCDFYSQIPCKQNEALFFSKYTECLLSEIAARKAEIASTLGHNTLYIGGGTPSVLPLNCLRAIVDALSPYAPFSEFTLELNPEDIVLLGKEYVQSLIDMGVTRFSMGVQSLDDTVLVQMNRRHNAVRARKAFELLNIGGYSAENTPFVGVCEAQSAIDAHLGRRADRSIDIIFGWPGMSMQSLQKTIEEIVLWQPEHISAYQLSIEEGSALAKQIADGRTWEAPEEICAEQYKYLCVRLKEAGYEHYEISNWALAGHEAKHNSAYWARLPYVGLGPGAHSLRICGDGRQERSWNSQQLSAWTVEGSEVLSECEIREESIMLGLRTSLGVAPSLLYSGVDGYSGKEFALQATGNIKTVKQAQEVLASSTKAFNRQEKGRLQLLPNGNVRIAEDDFFIADDIISNYI